MINTFTPRYRDFSDENRVAIRDFLIHYASTGKKETSIDTMEDNLVTLFKKIGAKKSYKTITNCDIDNALQKSGWILSAQETLKRSMKQFLVYHKRKKIADGIILNSNICKTNKPHDSILTPDEIERLLNCFNEPMNSALIETLLVTGARLGEIQSLNVGSVRFEDDIVWIDLRSSKTKIRSIPLIPNPKNPVAIYPKRLETWLRVHPSRNTKDAPLFLSRSVEVKYYNQRISHQGIQRMIRRAKTLTGIKKPLHPHIFRHTGASYDGEILNEQMLCTKYGWQIGSPMTRIYCHVDTNNLVRVLREHAGIKPGEPPQEKICPRCGEHNNINAELCTRCSMILDTKKLMEELEKRKHLEQEIRNELTAKYEKELQEIGKKIDVMKKMVENQMDSWFKHQP
jgi:site-specific recombinase XerD/ribosomal protein L40E